MKKIKFRSKRLNEINHNNKIFSSLISIEILFAKQIASIRPDNLASERVGHKKASGQEAIKSILTEKLTAAN